MQEQFEIVKAGVSDFAAITALYLASDEYHYQQMRYEFKQPQEIAAQRTEESFKSLILDENHVIYLAKINGDICGLIAGKVFDQQSFIQTSRMIGYIDEVSVSIACRGRGIAKKLVGKLEMFFEMKNVDEVSLSVYAFNQGAAELYRTLGYKEKILTMSRSLAG